MRTAVSNRTLCLSRFCRFFLSSHSKRMAKFRDKTRLLREFVHVNTHVRIREGKEKRLKQTVQPLLQPSKDIYSIAILQLLEEFTRRAGNINPARSAALAVFHALHDARGLPTLGTIRALAGIHDLLTICCFCDLCSYGHGSFLLISIAQHSASFLPADFMDGTFQKASRRSCFLNRVRKLWEPTLEDSTCLRLASSVELILQEAALAVSPRGLARRKLQNVDESVT